MWNSWFVRRSMASAWRSCRTGAPTTPGMLGGAPPAERRGVLGAPLAYRPIRRMDRSARPEMILKPLGWRAKVVLTGIDVLVMRATGLAPFTHSSIRQFSHPSDSAASHLRL